MYFFNIDKEFFMNFIQIYLIILSALSAITMLFLLFDKLQRRKYISLAKKELEKIKGREQTILYKVGDFIENRIYDFGRCVLVIKGFDAVCDTLRRHWNHDDNLKLVYMIKGNYSIDVKIFFDNNGSWKQIEGLHNLSDGINYVNRYEIVTKENEKIKSISQMLCISVFAMLIGILPVCMFYLSYQSWSFIKINREMLLNIMAIIMSTLFSLDLIVLFMILRLQSEDKESPVLLTIQTLSMVISIFSILLGLVFWCVLK